LNLSRAFPTTVMRAKNSGYPEFLWCHVVNALMGHLGLNWDKMIARSDITIIAWDIMTRVVVSYKGTRYELEVPLYGVDQV
jgi:hypothetical protein